MGFLFCFRFIMFCSGFVVLYFCLYNASKAAHNEDRRVGVLETSVSNVEAMFCIADHHRVPRHIGGLLACLHTHNRIIGENSGTASGRTEVESIFVLLFLMDVRRIPLCLLE